MWKTTFLNGMIEDEVYIQQPKGFETLEQAPHAWYTRIDSYFTGLDFMKSELDPNLYHIVVDGKLLMIILYVDDLILTCDDNLIKS